MNLKELLEKRAAKQAEMKAILDMAKQENRSLNEEDSKKFDDLEKEIRELDATIRAYQTSRELEAEAPVVEKEEEKKTPWCNVGMILFLIACIGFFVAGLVASIL